MEKEFDWSNYTAPKAANEPVPDRVTFWTKLSNKFYGWWYRLTDSKKKYLIKGMSLSGLPTIRRVDGSKYRDRCAESEGHYGNYGLQIVESEVNPLVYEGFVKPRSEVITPTLEDTLETLAQRVSQAANDMEFPRVIVYPISGQMRIDLPKFIESDPERYPMYEYWPANIVSNNELDSTSIIYKYKYPG